MTRYAFQHVVNNIYIYRVQSTCTMNTYYKCKAIDIMSPIYYSLQDRLALSHGNNHVSLQDISDLCVPGLQDVCTIETAVLDLHGERTRWRPRASSGVDEKRN